MDMLDPGAYFLLGQRPLPTGVCVGEDQGRHKLRVAAVELQHDCAAP